MKSLLMKLIRVYQGFISPLLPPSCRFEPTCSQYTLQAIDRFGAIQGTCLGVKRIWRCNPFQKGGYDPVPTLEQMQQKGGIQFSNNPNDSNLSQWKKNGKNKKS